MSRQTIRENPLDTLPGAPEEAKHSSRKSKQRLTVQISESVVDRAKNTVYWTRGLTLAQLTEEALEKALSALEKNSSIFCDKTGNPLKKKGEPYPKRKDKLKSGRPVK